MSDTKVQLAVATSRSLSHSNSGPTRLSIPQLAGVFILWLIGMAISSAAFIWERYVKMKKVFTINVLS